jgi:hypothetical protein
MVAIAVGHGIFNAVWCHSRNNSPVILKESGRSAVGRLKSRRRRIRLWRKSILGALKGGFFVGVQGMPPQNDNLHFSVGSWIFY